MIKSPKGVWIRPWSPAALDNQSIARLVTRPYLIFGAQKYTGRAFDAARKAPFLNAATAPSWVNSPYGPALRFVTGNNYVYGAGAAGATYPATTTAVRPFSIAVLCRPGDTTSFQSIGFSMGASGGGVRISYDFGQTLFVATGIAGYAIGPANGASDYMLSLFSADGTTARSRHLNVTTGSMTSADEADAGMNDPSGDPSIGGTSFRDFFADVVGVAYVRGAWTQAEMAMITRDPTGIWRQRPRVRPSYKSGSATAYTLAMGAGSFVLTGNAAGLKADRKLAMGTGAFALTGQAAGLKAGRKLTMGTGAFALTGVDGSLRYSAHDRILAMGAGAFALTFNAAALKAARQLALGVGAFTLTGNPAALRAARTLGLGAGSYQLTMNAAALRATHALPMGAGVFVLVGGNLALVYNGSGGVLSILPPFGLLLVDPARGLAIVDPVRTLEWS